MAYKIEERNDRVYAVDTLDGVEICGAFSPVGHNYWQLYVTHKVQHLTGLHIPPHREHFWADSGRAAATSWIEMIASLYSLASSAVSVIGSV